MNQTAKSEKSEKEVTVRLPVTAKNGGVRHKPGTSLSLAESEAKRLLKRWGPYRGPVEPAAPARPAKPQGNDLIAAIAAAIGALDLKNEDHVTASGKPNVAALEKILGYDISAEERDAGFNAFKRG